MMPRLGLYEKAICFKLEWKAKLELARSSGFSFLELNIDAAEDRLPRLYRGNEALALRRAIEEENFPVETLGLSANRGFPLGSEDTAVLRRKIFRSKPWASLQTAASPWGRKTRQSGKRGLIL